jgi:hypothetical protein
MGNAAFLFLVPTVMLPLEQSMQVQSVGSRQHNGKSYQAQDFGQEQDQEEIAASETESNALRARLEQGQRFRDLFTYSLVCVTVLNLPFTVFAYMSFGDSVKDNVIDNLTPGLVTNVVKVLLCVDLLFTGVLFLFPISEGLDRGKVHNPNVNAV